MGFDHFAATHDLPAMQAALRIPDGPLRALHARGVKQEMLASRGFSRVEVLGLKPERRVAGLHCLLGSMLNVLNTQFRAIGVARRS